MYDLWRMVKVVITGPGSVVVESRPKRHRRFDGNSGTGTEVDRVEPWHWSRSNLLSVWYSKKMSIKKSLVGSRFQSRKLCEGFDKHQVGAGGEVRVPTERKRTWHVTKRTWNMDLKRIGFIDVGSQESSLLWKCRGERSRHIAKDEMKRRMSSHCETVQ